MKRWVPLIFVAGCVRVAASPAVSVPEVWVDGSAAEGGDGSRGAPYRAIPPAPSGRVHLKTGLYAGPVQLGGGAQLVGEGEVVLHAQGEAVVRAADASLAGITLQGGQVGLVSQGKVALERVTFSGQRQSALVVRSGEVRGRQVTFTATVSETVGASVEAGATFSCERCVFDGPFRRGVDTHGAVTLDASRFEGAVTGVQAEGGAVRLTGVRLAGGRGPALFASGALLSAERVEVTGYEYAVLARGGATVDAHTLVSQGARVAGLGLVGVKARLQDIRLLDSGLQMVGGDLDVKHLLVERARDYGINARQGRLVMADVDVAGTAQDAEEGDGVHLRDIQAELSGLNVTNVPGVCLVAAEGAKVTVRDAVLNRCHRAGVEADALAELSLFSVRIHGSAGPGVVVPARATVRADVLELSHTGEAPVWAECGEGAQVYLSRFKSDAPLPSSRCVWRWEARGAR